ncbi:MAG TPA: hypothetical protein IAB45_03445 [Candidatus Onthousia faecavium]|nr:hypothetical protein [Candidatus Onthousia faecavium]
MSAYETTISNPKKQLEFYKDLSEQLQQENRELKNSINKAAEIIKNDRNYDDNDFEGRIFQKDILNALGVDYDECI